MLYTSRCPLPCRRYFFPGAISFKGVKGTFPSHSPIKKILVKENHIGQAVNEIFCHNRDRQKSCYNRDCKLEKIKGVFNTKAQVGYNAAHNYQNFAYFRRSYQCATLQEDQLVRGKSYIYISSMASKSINIRWIRTGSQI